MKILSIDTASNICGVSILDNSSLICQLDQDTGRTHSENLMPMIEQAFQQSHLTLNDIDLLVCDKGPGSFTGIRIGVATVKAFHDSLNIPCIGVNSLETLAYSIKNEGFIVSILDAKNKNCYFAIYQLKNSQYQEILSPRADLIENALEMCWQKIPSDSSITFVGDGSINYQELICHKFGNGIFATLENNSLNSYYVGLVGLTKFEKKDFQDVLPLYLKKPQAQRQLEENLKNISITSMTQEDLNQISNVLLTDFDDFWNDEILKNELTAKNSIYILAKFNEKIVGFAGIKIIMEEAHIMNIVVRKDFRNQGIGSVLLQNLIHLSKQQNLSSITLEVMEENYSAIHLYKNLGFEQIGTRKNYYKNKNAFIMTKKLI